MITKEGALNKIRDVYSKDNYVTGMSKWRNYFIFNLKAKDPEHKMETNQPFYVCVNNDGEIGVINLAQEAKNKGCYDEYIKACKDSYESLDSIPEDESNWFINKLLKEIG